MALDFYSNKEQREKGKLHSVRSPQILSTKKDVVSKQIDIDYRRLTWVVLIFIFLLIIWWLLVSKTFTVKDIIYEQEPSVEIKEKIESLRGENILLLQLTKLGESWQEEQPIIKSLHIYRGLPHTLRVGVEERSKAIVWKSGDHYYLLDASGIAYENTGNSLEENFLPIIDDNNIKVELGSKIVAKDFIIAAQKLLDEIPGKIGDETIKEMHVGESTFNIDVITDKNIRIKFDIMQPIDLQLEALEYVYKEKRNDVRKYIDVRVVGKAYLK